MLYIHFLLLSTFYVAWYSLNMWVQELLGRRFNLIILCSKGTWNQGTGVRLQHLFLIKLQIPGTGKAHNTLSALSPTTMQYNKYFQISFRFTQSSFYSCFIKVFHLYNPFNQLINKYILSSSGSGSGSVLGSTSNIKTRPWVRVCNGLAHHPPTHQATFFELKTA